MLDSGWLQVYVEDAQESLDMMIQAYAIAEHKEVLTPVMVNLDGFVLTHTYELVEVPRQEDVDEFLPPFDTENKLDFENPKNMCFSSSPSDNMEFKYQQHKAALKASEVIKKVDQSYREKFGRGYGGLVDGYRCDDAEIILITLGSITGTCRVVVDELRSQGKKVGVLKIRFMRPFPEKEILDITRGAKVIGVLEKDISFGYEGTVYTNVNSALIKSGRIIKSYNFIAGLGGRDISREDIKYMYDYLEQAASGAEKECVKFINLGVDTDGE